jgi:cyclomaltodextrinase
MRDGHPLWVQDCVFYQILPDRFARSPRLQKPGNLEEWNSRPTHHGFKGGDLLGIVEHLNYLDELAVYGLYINPIFQATSNHRYNTHDYFQIDPLLGGQSAFDELLEQAHRRGMRVILDGVFNHTGRSFLKFADILENGQSSPWLDWFGIEGWPLSPYDTSQPANYRGWHNIRALPELNLENPEVREFIYQVGEYWLSQGIDGWRLDFPESIQVPGFWEEFRRRMKAANPEAALFGEVWRDPGPWLQAGLFDGVTNYIFAGAVLAFAAGERVQVELIRKPNPTRDYDPAPPLDAVQFGNRVEGLLHISPTSVHSTQLNLLDSHDTPRLFTMTGGDLPSVKLAFLFQMAYPGVPCIYYGDEIGLAGGPDPDCRRAFLWDEPETWDRDLLD